MTQAGDDDARAGASGLPPFVLWVDATPRPGWRNMALDQALLERAERRDEGWLRLYRWEPFCLSFGRNEPAARRYDRAAIARLGLDAVRRPTGGRAVWHARELTYAVTAPSAWFGSLPEAYGRIHRTLAAAVRALGAADAALADPPGRAAPVDAGACFAQPAGGEILVGGRKVLGSAQYRQGPALLQHGSLLLEDDQSLLQRVTVGGSPGGGQEAALSAALGRTVSFAEAADAVAEAARNARTGWPGAWRAADAAAIADVLAGAAAHEETYRSEAWTWRR